MLLAQMAVLNWNAMSYDESQMIGKSQYLL